MNDVIKFTEGLQKKITSNSRVTIIAVVACCLTVLFCLMASLAAIKACYGNVYVLAENGSIEKARRQDRASVIDKEIHSHVQTFHEYFYNLSPDSELITANKEAALTLGDKTAFEAWNNRDSDHFYSRLVSTGTIEQFKLDSMKVVTTRYPYFVRTFGKIYLLRKDTTTQYDFVSDCEVVNAQRTDTNPHGMIIEHFEVRRFDKVETRKRK